MGNKTLVAAPNKKITYFTASLRSSFDWHMHSSKCYKIDSKRTILILQKMSNKLNKCRLHLCCTKYKKNIKYFDSVFMVHYCTVMIIIIRQFFQRNQERGCLSSRLTLIVSKSPPPPTSIYTMRRKI